MRDFLGFGLPSTQDQKPDAGNERQRIEALASRHQVPANVLMALAEKGANLDAEAPRLGQALAGGATLDKVVSPELLNRAYDIADAVYPRSAPPPKEPSLLRDVAAGAGGALVSGAGYGLDYVGATLADGLRQPGIETAIGAVAEPVKSAGTAISDMVSPETQQAAQDSLWQGSILEPSTLGLPKDVSVRGLLQIAAQGVGSMAPAVLASVASRNPAAAGFVVSGAMGGGAARDQAAQEIDTRWQEKDASGITRLERESDVFRALVAQGFTREQAYAEVRNRSMDTAGNLAAVVAGAGGAATGKIIGGVAGGSTRVARGLRGVAASGLEEGIQEVGEGIATNAGINVAAGTDISLGQDSAANFMAGAVGGGPFGALAALPQGGRGLPRAQEQNPGADGSRVGPDAAPVVPPDAGAADPGLSPDVPRETTVPTGPASRVAAAAPDLTPVPEPEPAPQRFPDQKPGAQIRLADPEGKVWEAVFLRETPDGVVFRIAGEELTLPDADFDEALTLARAADAEAKAAATGKPPQTAPVENVTTRPAMPEGGFADQASAGIKPPVRGLPDAKAPETPAPVPPAQGAGPSQPGGGVVSTGGPRSAQPPLEGMGQVQGGRPAGTGVQQTDPRNAGQSVAPLELTKGSQDGQETGLGAGVVRSDPAGAGVEGGRQAAAQEPGSGQSGAGAAGTDPRTPQTDTGAVAGRATGELKPHPGTGEDTGPTAPILQMEEPPTPDTAPWWDSGDEAFKKAVLKESGLSPRLSLSKPFRTLPEKARKSLTDSFGKLYRAGKIDRTGTTEEPRFTLRGETIDAVAADAQQAALPSPDSVQQAAAETDPEPTPAQAEAENYRTGKAQWNGLTLSVENAKGSIRRKVTPDGKTAWEVTMPAHYGRILRTTGADGDHVDFYMGDTEDSPSVWLVDQVDLKTGAFDEHKAMLGMQTAQQAADTYAAGFSDGKGRDRMGGITKMTVQAFKDWLAEGDMKKPVSRKMKAAAAKGGEKTSPLDTAPPAEPSKTAPAAAEPASVQPRTDQEPVKNAEAAGTSPSSDAGTHSQSSSTPIDPRAVPPTPPKRLSPKAQQAARAAAIAEYFTPGNIVTSYGGGHDRVIAFNPGQNGDWSVEVQAVRKVDGAWAADKGERIRNHRTSPTERGLKAGPVERAAQPALAAVAPSEQVKPEPEAPPVQAAIDFRPIRDDVAVTPEGTRIPVQYALVEMADLVPSNSDDGRVNPAYPQARQPRDRSGTNTQRQIQKIMRDFDPRLLDMSPNAGDGAPIIDRSGIVESGNGRVMAMSRIYRDRADLEQQYIDHLEAQGYPVDGMKQPVLVRIRTSEMTEAEIKQIARESNARPQLAMTATEQAMADAAALPEFALALYRGEDVDAAGNRDFVRAFMQAVVPENDQAQMIDQNTGAMSQDAVRRIQGALLAKAYGNAEIVSALIEASDSNVKAIGGALLDVSPAWAQMRAEAKAETIAPEMDQTAALIEAVQVVNRARSSGRNVAEFVSQGDLLSGESGIGAMAQRFLALMFRDTRSWTKPTGRDRIVRALAFYVDEARKSSAGPDLFGDKATPDQVAAKAREKQSDEGSPAGPDLFSGQTAAGDGERVRSPGAGGDQPGTGTPVEPERGKREAGRGEGDLKTRPAVSRASKAAPSAKIEDFGEKILGARKDAWASYAERLAEAEDVDVAMEPLSVSWPVPDYGKMIEGGIDPWSVAFVRAARDMIPRKPTKAWKLKGWVAQVQTLRDFASGLVKGDIDRAELARRLEAHPALSLPMIGVIDLYLAVGHDVSLSGIKFGEHTYSMMNGVYHPSGLSRWEVTMDAGATAFSNMPRVLASGETREEAIDAFKKVHGNLGGKKQAEAKKTKFLIYSKDKRQTWTIGVKIGPNHIDIRTAPDVNEARRILAEEGDALQAQLDRMRDIPKERGDTNAPRVGADHRAGADVAPAQFAETFGFRGVQFGNWVEGDRRQADLNEAYDALMDMAGILDLPPKALSLNGALGLAFGARGVGGKNAAAAHYEPNQVVINLTKKAGKGSLAHEWFHALDNYFGKQRSPTGGTYITDALHIGWRPSDGVRPQITEAFQQVKQAIAATKLRERSSRIDQMRSSPYWGTGVEIHARAFESYVIAKLQDQSASNDYLANVVNGTAWGMLAEASGLGDSYPYLKEQEITVVRPAFDALFQAIETRETERGVEMFMQREGDESATPEPVASLTGNELGAWSDVSQLGRKAESWYRDNLVGQTVTNTATGMEIGFNRRGSRKIGGRKGEDLYRIVPALRDILAKGVLVETQTDRMTRAEVKAIHKIAASVRLAGVVKNVIATVREMHDGTFHYDLSMDSEAGGFSSTTVQDESRTSALEGGPADLNIAFVPEKSNGTTESPRGWGEVEAAQPITDADIRKINVALNAEMRKHKLAGKVPLAVVREVFSRTLFGMERRPNSMGNFGPRGIQVKAGATVGELGVLRHEIIHALRSPHVWGAPGGLFSDGEWQALVKAARADAGLMDSITRRYPDLPHAKQIEEAVAELYRNWAHGQDQKGLVQRAFERIKGFFEGLARALRGEGFADAAMVMERIASGKVGRRGGTPEVQFLPVDSEMRADPIGALKRTGLPTGTDLWQKPSDWLSNKMTDAMVSGSASILGTVPTRPLFAELGKHLPAAQTFLRVKEQMDADRSDLQAHAAAVMNRWYQAKTKDRAAVDRLHNLMHSSTVTGIDPTGPDEWKHPMERDAHEEISKRGSDAEPWAFGVIQEIEDRRKMHESLSADYAALPKDVKAIYGEALKTHNDMGRAFEGAVIGNIEKATRFALRRAERAHKKALEDIRDDGLEGTAKEAAVAAADEKLAKVKRRAGWGLKARLADLRAMFETNKLAGPYFPLARFGDYFVTVRNDKGKVISFSRFETEAKQQKFLSEAKDQRLGKTEFGVLSNKDEVKGAVDSEFITAVEDILDDADVAREVMDAVWQRWLETLPDMSVRTARIHRQNREGWDKDALRAFASATMHGSHQLARLRYSMDLYDTLDVAQEEARTAANPNRAQAVVNEMRKRLEWIMNPTSAAWTTKASSFAFVWYLAASPAAAIVNLSQTTVIGPAMMKARFRKAGLGRILKHLGQATKDFSQGQGVSWRETWSAENAKGLTDDERAAMRAGYKRGLIDRTQAHDLAAVAESGVEFSPLREKWMRRIGWGFHHAERFNREVTYLAAYRLAREDGQAHDAAVQSASDLTWQTHFSYLNSDRPRIMQGDFPKLFLQFRQYTVNLLFRLFRDVHQSLHGATPEERREARTQLIGITLSMFAHAGIRGVWGYGLLMMLLGAFLPGADDGDDVDEWLQDALLMEGDGPGVAAWNWIAGAILQGVPGRALGIDLSERIGSPNLWFRGDDRNLDGEETLQSYVNEVLGPTIGTMFSFARGFDLANEGHYVRALENAVPKGMRDIIRTARYATEGVETKSGDDIVQDISPWELFLQAVGFVPSRVAQQYKLNSRLMNEQAEVEDRRKAIHRAVGDAVLAGEPIPQSVLDDIRDFNRDVPVYPITRDTIRKSIAGRQRASARNEGGIQMNPKLNDWLREQRAPAIYN